MARTTRLNGISRSSNVWHDRVVCRGIAWLSSCPDFFAIDSEKECFAVIFGIQKFSQYPHEREFSLESDHN